MSETNDCQILELDHPHGFLIWRGKQTALGTPESLPVGEKLLVISEGEAFGYVTLKTPAQMNSAEFDREEYHKEHRLYPTEWRLDWPDTKMLNLYRFESWEPFDEILPFENGEIIIEKPTPHEAALIDKSRYLPKTLVLDDEAITMTGGKFTVSDGLSIPGDLEQILSATYETEVEFTKQTHGKYLPLYRLALVRVPNMRIKKKESQPDSEVEPTEPEQVSPEVVASTKQEDHPMPWEKVTDHPDCPSDKPVAALNTSEAGDMAKQSDDKQESLQAKLERIHQQFMTTFMMSGDGEDEYKNDHDVWVVDVFDSFLIANVAGKLYRVSYMDTESGVIFAPMDAWVEVEVGYNPKGFALLAGDHKQFDDSEWSGAASQWDTADAYCSDCLIDVNPSGEDKIKDLCFLPFRKPGSQRPNLNSLRTMASGRGITALRKPADVSSDTWDSQLRRAANRLISWWPDAFDKPAPDSIYRVAGKNPPSDNRSWKDRLREAAKTISDFVQGAEYETKEQEIEPMDLKFDFSKPFGVAVKTVNGEPWHFSWSTNAFRDRDGEIFTTKALENFVIESEQNGYKGFFNFWHISGTDFAVKEWKAVIGRFLVEAGPYLDNEAGKRAKAFFQQYSDGHPDIAPEGWGASPEFRFLPEERAKDGIFHWLWITRTSTLPRAAAANIWTKGSQIMASMTQQQEQAAIVAFGKDFVENLKLMAEKETTALEQVADHKAAESPEESTEPAEAEVTQTETEPEASETEETESEESESEGDEAVPVVNVDVEELAAEVKKQFEFDLQPVAQAMAEILEQVKAVGDRVTKLEKQEAVKQQVETPRFMLNLVRASQAEETAVADDDDLKGQKPKETRPLKDGSVMSQIFPSPK